MLLYETLYLYIRRPAILPIAKAKPLILSIMKKRNGLSTILRWIVSWPLEGAVCCWFNPLPFFTFTFILWIKLVIWSQRKSLMPCSSAKPGVNRSTRPLRNSAWVRFFGLSSIVMCGIWKKNKVNKTHSLFIKFNPIDEIVSKTLKQSVNMTNELIRISVTSSRGAHSLHVNFIFY